MAIQLAQVVQKVYNAISLLFVNTYTLSGAITLSSLQTTGTWFIEFQAKNKLQQQRCTTCLLCCDVL